MLVRTAVRAADPAVRHGNIFTKLSRVFSLDETCYTHFEFIFNYI